MRGGMELLKNSVPLLSSMYSATALLKLLTWPKLCSVVSLLLALTWQMGCLCGS